MNTVQPLGLLVGRVLLALIFIGSGFSKITGFADTAASMAGKGIPMVEGRPIESSDRAAVASVVVVNCPPGSRPATITGSSAARAA